MGSAAFSSASSVRRTMIAADRIDGYLAMISAHLVEGIGLHAVGRGHAAVADFVVRLVPRNGIAEHSHGPARALLPMTPGQLVLSSVHQYEPQDRAKGAPCLWPVLGCLRLFGLHRAGLHDFLSLAVLDRGPGDLSLRAASRLRIRRSVGRCPGDLRSASSCVRHRSAAIAEWRCSRRSPSTPGSGAVRRFRVLHR